MKLRLAVLVVLLLPALAGAQPASLTVSAPVSGPSSVTFTLTWSGGGSFPWVRAFNDNSAFQQGAGAGSPFALTMPYHSSGAASGGWVCVGTAPTWACAGLLVPAPPVTPPGSTRVDVGYREPSTNADGTPLTDLATVKIYYRIDGGPEQAVAFVASSPTGGRIMTNSVTVPTVQGTWVAVAAATNAVGGESVRSAPTSLVLGPGLAAPDKGGITVNPITQ